MECTLKIASTYFAGKLEKVKRRYAYGILKQKYLCWKTWLFLIRDCLQSTIEMQTSLVTIPCPISEERKCGGALSDGEVKAVCQLEPLHMHAYKYRTRTRQFIFYILEAASGFLTV